ncbi:MAG: helix-turn-helix domain-containing protein [Verrucomicrobiota bacterium]
MPPIATTSDCKRLDEVFPCGKAIGFRVGTGEETYISVSRQRKPLKSAFVNGFAMRGHSLHWLLEGQVEYRLLDPPGSPILLSGGARFQRKRGVLHQTVPVGCREVDELVCYFSVDVAVQLEAVRAFPDPFWLTGPFSPLGLAQSLEALRNHTLGQITNQGHTTLHLLTGLIDQWALGAASAGETGEATAVLREARVLLGDPEFYHLSIEQIAERLGMSGSSLRRKFHAYFGVSPSVCRRNSRFQLAAERLIQGRTVKTVAYELGYQDPFAFSHEFSKTFGVPPSQFADGERP